MWNSTVPSDENPDQNSIDAGSSMRKPISLWPGMYHSPVTNALWEARRNMFEIPTGDDASQSKLTAKSPSRSRTSILYKFSSDFVLREQYRNPWNEIRTGKLVEDLDALAGTISFKVLVFGSCLLICLHPEYLNITLFCVLLLKQHCGGDSSARSMILVTASVDRIIMKRPIRVDTDLSIVGAVTWVGRSSMEMQLQVLQIQGISFSVNYIDDRHLSLVRFGGASLSQKNRKVMLELLNKVVNKEIYIVVNTSLKRCEMYLRCSVNNNHCHHVEEAHDLLYLSSNNCFLQIPTTPLSRLPLKQTLHSWLGMLRQASQLQLTKSCQKLSMKNFCGKRQKRGTNYENKREHRVKKSMRS
jgi:hypothetical protein